MMPERDGNAMGIQINATKVIGEPGAGGGETDVGPVAAGELLDGVHPHSARRSAMRSPMPHTSVTGPARSAANHS